LNKFSQASASPSATTSADNREQDGASPSAAQSPPRPTGRRVLVNTGALAGSSLWRIAVSFVLQLFIARGLGAQALGQYTVALAYLNVCQVLSELGLQTLLVRDLAQTPALRRDSLRIALSMQLAASLLIWLGLWLLTQLLPFGPTTRMALLLVGATLPFFAVTSACQMIFQAGERMEIVMGVEVTINTLIVGLSLFLLWQGRGVLTLVSVLILTQAISAALCLVLLARSRLLAPPQTSVPWQPLRLGRRALPFYGLALADVLLNRLDILLLGALGGPTLTGIYSAAYNVVRILVKLIQSFWQALYPTLSRLHQHLPRQYRRLSALSMRNGLVLTLLAAAVGTGTADELLHLIYGADFGAAAQTFRVLIWMAPTFLVETYAILILMVERHPRHSLLITGLHVLTLVIALPLLTWQFGALGAAVASLLASALGALCGLWLLRIVAGTVVLPSPVALVGAALLAALASLFLPLPWMACGAVSTSLYVAVLWYARVITPADLRALYHSALRSNREQV
jgi:O-antigen/teichoic acid export membrane protein